MLSLNEHVQPFFAEDLCQLYECRGLIRLRNAGNDAILRAMANNDCQKARHFYKESGQRVPIQLKSALDDLNHELP